MAIGKSSGRGGLAAALEAGYLLMGNAKFLIAFALLGALLSAGYALESFPSAYEATAKLSQADGLPASLTGERRQAFKAWAVRRAVIDSLEKRGAPRQMERMLRVRNIAGTRMLYITAQSESPAEAAAIANECAAAARKLSAGGRLRLLAPALPPARPVSPGAARIVLLALVSGGLVASGVMMAQFLSGDRSRTRDGIRAFTGMPILAPEGALGLRQPVRKQAFRLRAARGAGLGAARPAAGRRGIGAKGHMNGLADIRHCLLYGMRRPACRRPGGG